MSEIPIKEVIPFLKVVNNETKWVKTDRYMMCHICLTKYFRNLSLTNCPCCGTELRR